MTERIIANTEHEEGRRADLRSATLDVRAWTGRSSLTSATTTTLPHFATAGTRTTRVSAMRVSGPGTTRLASDGAFRFQGRVVMHRCVGDVPAERG